MLPNQNLTYSITVTNAGPSTALAVLVNDPLPVGTIFLSCSVTQGTCVGPPIGTNGTVSATLGTIAPSGSATVTILVQVTAPSGVLFNTATISSGTPDPNPSNNSPSTQTQVGATAAVPMLSPLSWALLLFALAGVGILLLNRR